MNYEIHRDGTVTLLGKVVGECITNDEGMAEVQFFDWTQYKDGSTFFINPAERMMEYSDGLTFGGGSAQIALARLFFITTHDRIAARDSRVFWYGKDPNARPSTPLPGSGARDGRGTVSEGP